VTKRTRQSTPSTDEQIAAATIGEPDRIDAPIQLAQPDPAWPDMFAREALRICSVLGDRVHLLEHVGSTSIPGLPAKPIIDIVMAVTDSADESSYVLPLEQAGYSLRIREPHWHEHRVLKGPDTDVNLHVFTIGSPEIERMIGFRDHLRNNPEDLARYAQTKAELAGRTWKYVQNYADAKSAVIEAIISRALPT
jgi:GrpB-like predicted nucleotidyltransferase (UPF0157 family)